MISPDTIIRGYRVTEKATQLIGNLNQYTFEVYPSADRTQVARAIEKLFDVKVKRVNILNAKGKTKRSRTVRGQTGKKADSKRAIITLKEGENIELV